VVGDNRAVEPRTETSDGEGGEPAATRVPVESTWLDAASVVVRPRGALDAHSVPDLRHELSRIVENGASLVVVDLTTTSFIDSMTIGVLLGAVRRLQQHGGELRLACADPNIMRIFEMTLLDRVFAIYPSSEAALGSSAVGR
jgi:anti-sigma B factor antagonist